MKPVYEIFTGADLEIATLINKRRMQMLVHSCIYYGLNNNLIDDATFDKWAFELKDLQDKYPEIAKNVPWADAFKDWTGDSGAFLPYNDERIVAVANRLLGKESIIVKPATKKEVKPIRKRLF